MKQAGPRLMKLLRNTVIRAGLEALYFSGAHYLLRPIFAGVGAIFMLHHVRPCLLYTSDAADE